MPYIKKEDRSKFKISDQLIPENVGELNYLITRIIHRYIERKGLRYGNINEVVGALECAKLEIYRRVAAPYEDKKILENGDVGVLGDDVSSG